MKIFEVTPDMYRVITHRFAGMVFHRIDSNGRHLIKPLRRLEVFVSQFGTEVIS